MYGLLAAKSSMALSVAHYILQRWCENWGDVYVVKVRPTWFTVVECKVQGVWFRGCESVGQIQFFSHVLQPTVASNGICTLYNQVLNGSYQRISSK